MKEILIIYKFLPQYRVDFFNLLREELLRSNIELVLIYGKRTNIERLKNDEVDIDWAIYVPNRRIKFGRFELIWQPCLKYLRNKDIIVVESANKLILNYYLIFSRIFAKYKIAFWGHGRNLQQNLGSIPNRFKSFFINKCDWWFAYTERVKKNLIAGNYDAKKITVVQNAIDTHSLQKWYKNIGNHDIERLIDRLGIRDTKTALFCGSMYPDKRIDFIISSCRKIKDSIPEFHMLFIGAGEDSIKVIQASKEWNWIHYIGPKFGPERIKYFKVSMVQLMPFAVGLAILDSFAMETPIITTDNPFHGPEIEYLMSGYNGYITKSNIFSYAQTVIEILNSEKYLKLVEGCKHSAKQYSVEAMVDNFATGIQECIALSKN